MERRSFIKGTLGAGVACSLAGVLSSASSEEKKILIHLYLDGGPDFRQLIVPPQMTDYGQVYWDHRYPAWNLNSRAEVDSLEENLLSGGDGEVPFFFHPLAGWLQEEWYAGNVAVLNQTLGSDKRNHEFGSIVMETGDPLAKPSDRQKSGWGGRLAREMGGKIVSLTSRVRQFSYGPGEQDPLSHDNRDVLSVHDMRQFGLFRPESLDTKPAHRGYRESLSRALNAYYKEKSPTLTRRSPYRPVADHFEKLSHQGNLVRERLSAIEPDKSLAQMMSGDRPVNNRGFARQCSNFLDATSCLDILNASVFSMAYGGFDTHRDQSSRISERFSDIFGSTGPLASMMGSLRSTSPDIADRVVIMVSGEFGRQLAANGDQGTDHGRGNSVLMIGKNVSGGLYGDLFPEEEIDRYDSRGSDVHGMVGIENIVHQVCESIHPGSGDRVVPVRPEERNPGLYSMNFMNG